ASIFNLMDASRQKNKERRDQYPTPYTFFNQQVSSSLMNGHCDFGFNTIGSVAALRTSLWPAQLALAQANGLTLRQYEGGSHFVGDAYLCAFGGNALFTEFMLQHGHSREIAAVYSAM